MLTLPYYMQSLRWAVPAGVMLGSAPTYIMLWSGWRAVTGVLPNRVYQIGDDFLYSLYQKLVLFFFENLSGVEIVLSGDAECLHGKKENAIFISNHQSEVDWIIADILAARQGSIGRIRYILKDGLKYLPLYGYYFRQHSCIYVRRSGKFKEKQASNQLDMLASSNTPFWMVVFPEGTRYNPQNTSVIVKSKQFAIDSALPAFEHVLTPRSKAIQLCVERLREKADAIYDVTAAYSNTGEPGGPRKTSPGLSDFLTGFSPKVHINIQRIDLLQVPSDDLKFKQWLHSRFEEKDRLLKRFYSDNASVAGTLSDKEQLSHFGMRYTFPVFVFFMGVNVPLMCTETGRSLYWKTALAATFAGWMWMTIRS